MSLRTSSRCAGWEVRRLTRMYSSRPQAWFYCACVLRENARYSLLRDMAEALSAAPRRAQRVKSQRAKSSKAKYNTPISAGSKTNEPPPFFSLWNLEQYQHRKAGIETTYQTPFQKVMTSPLPTPVGGEQNFMFLSLRVSSRIRIHLWSRALDRSLGTQTR